MAKTITQRIAFEGGKEMEVQLQSLGDAGTTAFKRLKSAADDAAGIGPRLVPVIDAIKNRLGNLGDATANLKDRFSTMAQNGQTVVTRFTEMGVAVTGLVAGFLKLVESAGKAAEQIENNAAAAGLSTESYQQLRNTFGLAGIDSDKFGGLMTKLNKSIGDGIKANLEYDKSVGDLRREYSSGKISSDAYSEGLRKLRENAANAVTVFNRLGLTISDYQNDPKKALEAVIQALGNMPRGIERSRLELELFGRAGSGVDIMVEKFGGLQKVAAALIPILSKTEIEVGVNLQRSFSLLGSILDVIKEKFLLTFGPVVQALIESVTTFVLNHQGAILGYANTILQALTPIIRDIRALLSGQEVDPKGFIGQLIEAFTQFAAGAKIAIAVVVTAWNGLVAIMTTVANVVNSIFGTKFTGQSLAIAAAILTISGAFSLVASVITTLVAVVGVLDAALVLVFGPAGAAIAGIVLLGLAIGALIAQIPGVQTAFNSVVDYITTTVQNFVTLFKLIGVAWQLVWQEVGSFAKSVLDTVGGWIDAIILKLKQAAALFGFGGGGNNPADTSGGFAQGGHVRGPGTSRSDSILARLSTGEHVTQASAVQYYGARFMDMINNMSIPRNVLEGLAGFANGGLVRALSPMATIPGFANGGLVNAVLPPSNGVMGRPFTLQIGGDTITGLTAEHSSVERLQRLAAKKHVAQGGVKPSWFA